MPGKHDHREALRPRGWAGSAGGDAGATKGERDGGGTEGSGEAGGGEKREARRRKEPAHAAAAVGLDPVCTVVPDDGFS